MIGAGAYQGATPESVAPALSAVKLWIVHLNPGTAIAIRAASPSAWIILRPDNGDDNAQVNVAGDASIEARTFAETRIKPALAAAPPGTYSATTGINEAWPAHDAVGLRWRAQFELALCRIVQGELGLPYAALSVPTGNLEASEIPIFAAVFREAWAVNYHAYLAPGLTVDTVQTSPYYLMRPVDLWLPALKKLGLTLRWLALECGTYDPPPSYLNFGPNDEADLVEKINHDLGPQWPEPAETFYGACAYGIGTVGKQSPWDLTSALPILAAAARNDPQPPPIHFPGAKPMALTVGPGLARTAYLIGPFTESETYDDPGTPLEVSKISTAKGYATYRKATNRVICTLDNGGVYDDRGNHGDGNGTLFELAPPFP